MFYGQTKLPDPLTLDQIRAAQDAASAAWAAVRVYWWAFGFTAIGVAINALIALIAIRGPERDRHTRDLEDRKRRARLYIRASLAGLRGLAVARRLQKTIEKKPVLEEHDAQDLANFCRRLYVRQKVIDHFIALGLRDVNLVGWLFETSVLLSALHDGINLQHMGMFSDPTAMASEVLIHRADRLTVLRNEFQRFATEKRAKDLSLQEDLDRVWQLGWLIQFWKKPETQRD